ncbi:MAG: hypothetical protein JSS84_10990 [Bacteroidetes bacterium]|nr:hypothetical protein [Bacteroidota bacterium]
MWKPTPAPEFLPSHSAWWCKSPFQQQDQDPFALVDRLPKTPFPGLPQVFFVKCKKNPCAGTKVEMVHEQGVPMLLSGSGVFHHVRQLAILRQYQLFAGFAFFRCVGIARKGLLSAHFLEGGKGP